uniref:Uncharacterized protein n=1 Tax=Oryza barthii TaxID=65489 RepID=A0A0D3GP57_9ORYZ
MEEVQMDFGEARQATAWGDGCSGRHQATVLAAAWGGTSAGGVRLRRGYHTCGGSVERRQVAARGRGTRLQRVSASTAGCSVSCFKRRGGYCGQ